MSVIPRSCHSDPGVSVHVFAIQTQMLTKKDAPIVGGRVQECSVGGANRPDRTRKKKAKGGKQGDALMPLLFSLGQQRALRAIAGELQAGERLFAFLDLHVSCQLARVAAIHGLMRVELWRHSKISVHRCPPTGVEEFQQLVSSIDEH